MENNFNLQNALQHQLSTLQDIIKRMAENGRNCKTWCLSIVAALLAFASKENSVIIITLVILPIFPLAFLDAYYLHLETIYINQYKCLVKDFKNNLIKEENVYTYIGITELKTSIFFQFRSKSIWPFYSIILLIVASLFFYLSFKNI
jgi:Gpi18-like mannosyltransferase